MYLCRVLNLLGVSSLSPMINSAVQDVIEHSTGLQGDASLTRISVNWGGVNQFLTVPRGEQNWDWLEDFLQCGRIATVEVKKSEGVFRVREPSLLREDDHIVVTTL